MDTDGAGQGGVLGPGELTANAYLAAERAACLATMAVFALTLLVGRLARDIAQRLPGRQQATMAAVRSERLGARRGRPLPGSGLTTAARARPGATRTLRSATGPAGGRQAGRQPHGAAAGATARVTEPRGWRRDAALPAAYRAAHTAATSPGTRTAAGARSAGSVWPAATWRPVASAKRAATVPATLRDTISRPGAGSAAGSARSRGVRGPVTRGPSRCGERPHRTGLSRAVAHEPIAGPWAARPFAPPAAPCAGRAPARPGQHQAGTP